MRVAGCAGNARCGGDEVELVASWGKDPGDEEVLRRAEQEGRVLVTLDKDFGELAIVQGMVHHGIVRLANLRAREQGLTARAVLERCASELSVGAIVTADATRTRVRPGGSA